MLGLETALAVAHGALCLEPGESAADDAERGWVPPRAGAAVSVGELLGWFSWKPARIAGLDQESNGAMGSRGGQGGPVRPGAKAHLCVFDPSATWVVDPARQASRSRNTPYAGRRLTGKVRHTVFSGEVVVLDGEAQR